MTLNNLTAEIAENAERKNNIRKFSEFFILNPLSGLCELCGKIFR